MRERVALYRVALDAAQERLQSRIKEIRRVFPHSGEIGGQIENVFKSELRYLIPEKIGITSGFVADMQGNISRQLDIIFYDLRNTPTIFSAEGVQILPVECTYAAGEVKTDLTTAKLADCFDKCISYKQLRREAFFPVKYTGAVTIKQTCNLYGEDDEHWPSLFFVLAMQGLSYEKLCHEATREIEERSLSARASVDCICCLNGAMMINAVVRNGVADPGISFTRRPGQSWAGYLATSPWALFIRLLLPPLVQAPEAKVDLNRYPDGDPF